MSNLVDEPMIPPKRKRGRHHDESENQEDWLSELPDCVLLHILSFLYTKDAVKTYILSTRWKHLWKRIPVIRLDSTRFPTLNRFDKFVSSILPLCDVSIALRTFDFYRHGSIQPYILKKIASYILSHSKQLHRLGIHLQGDIRLILPCVSACHALTSLELSVYHHKGTQRVLFPKYLHLPALTSLDLTNFVFSVDKNADHAEPFSAFHMLNSLIICDCAVRGAQILRIASATLLTLTIDETYSCFTIKTELSAPSLCTLVFKGTPGHKLCGNSLCSVKQVDIHACPILADEEHALVLFNWLLDLPNIASLTVTTHALLVLSLVPDLLKVEFPSLCNLKSLKVKMIPFSKTKKMSLEDTHLKNKSQKEASKIAVLEPAATIPDRIVAFLCQNSTSAEVNFIPE